MDPTLQYYNRHADSFCDDTKSVNMEPLYQHFTAYLPRNASILDCGCGSGRDSKYFIQSGYSVVAIDGSIELCKRASVLTGLQVQQMYFQDISFSNQFDGVWACSSLLHLKKSELTDVFNRIYSSLKETGLFYVSFKYGTFEGKRNGRYFTDLTEDGLNEIIDKSPGFQIHEIWITSDVREGRSDEKWLNATLKKL